MIQSFDQSMDLRSSESVYYFDTRMRKPDAHRRTPHNVPIIGTQMTPKAVLEAQHSLLSSIQLHTVHNCLFIQTRMFSVHFSQRPLKCMHRSSHFPRRKNPARPPSASKPRQPSPVPMVFRTTTAPSHSTHRQSHWLPSQRTSVCLWSTRGCCLGRRIRLHLSQSWSM